MTKTFLSGAEELNEMILKLVGKDNLPSQSVLCKICYNAGSRVAENFLRAVDRVGLYNERLYLLHQACGSSYVKTMDAVFLFENMLYAGKITQQNILELRSLAMFEGFVRAYSILEKIKQNESIDWIVYTTKNWLRCCNQFFAFF